MCCRLRGHREWDTTQRLSTTTTTQKPLSSYLQCKQMDQFSSGQSLIHVRLSATPWTAARQAALPITNSRGLLKLMSIESVMPSSHLSSAVLFSSCPQSFPASGSFQMTHFFASGGQSIGVSALTSVLPMNIQD